MSKIADLRGRLAAVNQEMKEIFEAGGEDLDLSAEQVDRVRVLKAEQDDIGGKISKHDEMAAIRDDAINASEPQTTGKELLARATGVERRAEQEPAKSFGDQFIESVAYTALTSTGGPEAKFDFGDRGGLFATLMQTTAGWAPQAQRLGGFIEEQVRPIQVLDLIPKGTTDSNSISYMEETTFTNNAAEIAQAGTYAESALALTEGTSPVQKIGTFLPVTDEQLEDVAGIRGYIDDRLRFMVRQRLDSQILVGNGTTPNLRGINNVVGIQTQAKGADTTPDAIYKAMTLVRVTGRAMPNAVVMHPNDWQDVRLLRTTDGIYIWGNPADSGQGNERIWGVPVVLAEAQTENTAVVGDFAGYSRLFMKRDLVVQVSNSHSTYFIEGKQAIRVDMRAALVFFRPQAFATVTGI